VEDKQETTGVAGAGTTSREFALRRWIESLLLVLGSGLLTVFAGAWIHRTVSSRAAIRQFEVRKHDDKRQTPGRAKLSASAKASFASWFTSESLSGNPG
jgi:hypothetical protein